MIEHINLDQPRKRLHMSLSLLWRKNRSRYGKSKMTLIFQGYTNISVYIQQIVHREGFAAESRYYSNPLVYFSKDSLELEDRLELGC